MEPNFSAVIFDCLQFFGEAMGGGLWGAAVREEPGAVERLEEEDLVGVVRGRIRGRVGSCEGGPGSGEAAGEAAASG